jgi:hypothetical protein
LSVGFGAGNQAQSPEYARQVFYSWAAYPALAF